MGCSGENVMLTTPLEIYLLRNTLGNVFSTYFTRPICTFGSSIEDKMQNLIV